MLTYLGRMLAARRQPLKVRYLNKAEAEPVWRDGWLLAVDPQGASFALRANGGAVECLPWGSIGSIRIGETGEPPADDAAATRPAFFGAEAAKEPGPA